MSDVADAQAAANAALQHYTAVKSQTNDKGQIADAYQNWMTARQRVSAIQPAAAPTQSVAGFLGSLMQPKGPTK